MTEESILQKNLVRNRKQRLFVNLLWALVSRDVRARYRRSLLGPLWAIIQPLFLMVVFSLLRGIVQIPSDGIPYPIFSYSTLVPWTFFATGVTAAGASVMNNAGILKKIAISREIFPLASVVTAGFDFIMSGLVLVGMMIYYQVAVTWNLLWVLPLILLTALLAFSIGMFLAALGTFKRDFLLAGSFLMQLWLYATPIIYPLSSVPDRWRSLYILNPMVGILEAFRVVITRGQSPDLTLLAWALPGLVLALVVSWPLFRRMSQYFADVL